MNGILNIELGGLYLHEWVLILFKVSAITLVMYVISRRVGLTILNFARSTQTFVDDAIGEVLFKTQWWFILATCTYLITLGSSSLEDRVALWIQRLFTVFFFIQIGIWITVVSQDWLHRYLKEEEDSAHKTTMSVLSFIFRIALYTMLFLVLLDNLGVNISALITGLGIGGIAVALALQRILGDIFSSLSIALDKPFVIGDFIVTGELLGSVEKIGLKTTRLRSLSGEQIVVSNTDLLSSRIRNFKLMEERRVLFTIAVPYHTPVSHLEEIPNLIKASIEAKAKTRFERAHFFRYGDYGLIFEIVYHVLDQDYGIYMSIQHDINLDIYRAFEHRGIRFALPTQHILLSQSSVKEKELP